MFATNRAETVDQAFTSKWLKVSDLNGKTPTVTIAAVVMEAVRQIDGSNQDKPIVSFKGVVKRLILNRTQAGQLASSLGSNRFHDWVGKQVQLYAATAFNGAATLGIRNAPAQSAPAPAATVADEDFADFDDDDIPF